MSLKIAENEFKCQAWGITEQTFNHQPIIIPRGNPGPTDIKIEIIQSGVCHSDITIGGSDIYGTTKQPFVGGHEIFGTVIEVGNEVEKFHLGEQIGVGCIVDSCLSCSMCDEGDEQQCQNGITGTQGAQRKQGRVAGNQALPTQGGYSACLVVNERFGIRIPVGIPQVNIAPIMCAGVTLQSPLKQQGALDGRKMRIGIVGIGGLGTMGIKLAKAMGHEVLALSTSPKKEQLAQDKGADLFCVWKDENSITKFAQSCDLVLNTIAFQHDIMQVFKVVKKKGVQVVIGIVKQQATDQILLCKNRWSLSGTFIGGVRDTEAVLEFCAKNKIWPDVEKITADKITEVWTNLENGFNADGARQVIDVKESLEMKEFCSDI